MYWHTDRSILVNDEAFLPKELPLETLAASKLGSQHKYTCREWWNMDPKGSSPLQLGHPCKIVWILINNNYEVLGCQLTTTTLTGSWHIFVEVRIPPNRAWHLYSAKQNDNFDTSVTSWQLWSGYQRRPEWFQRSLPVSKPVRTR